MTQEKTESKSDDSAAKAYAAAAADVSHAKGKTLVDALKADAAENTSAKVEAAPAPKPAVEAAPVAKAPVQKAPPKKAAAKKVAPAKKVTAKKVPAPKPVAAKPTPKKAATKKAAVKKSPAKPAKKAPAAKTKPTVTQLKEKIMATKTTDFTNVLTHTMTDAVKEVQERAQAAYEKSTASMTDMTDFAKGNVDAVVESGKILAEGVQTMGKTYADEAKSVYETATADLKEMASIKSPTDLFQLQGKIMRRNFDAMMAMTSKSTDAGMKLANDAMAPISGRVNVAAEKLSKVA